MFSAKFWRAAAERAGKSAAQALLLYAAGDKLANAWDADWAAAAGIALGAVVLSVLTSIASSARGDSDSPSLLAGER